MNSVLEYDMKEIYQRRNDWDRLKNKTVLLTGAYGMIASYLTLFFAFLNQNYGINVFLIALVKSKERFYEQFPDLRTSNYVFVYESDLKEPIKIDEKVDYIIHAASLASPNYYHNFPVDVIMPNVVGTNHLLNFARENKIDNFLLFSSGDIYGRTINETSVTEENYGALDTLDEHNCYSESKRMAETLCEAYFRQYNIPITIARIWHTYAPTMNINKDSRVFAEFTKNIINGENIQIKGDGKGYRSFCYVTDAIVGFFAILFDGKIGNAYNVCNSEQTLSILDLAKELISLRPEKNLTWKIKGRERNEQYSENVHLIGIKIIPSNEKLKGLSWSPMVDVRDGFNRVLLYHELEKNNDI